MKTFNVYDLDNNLVNTVNADLDFLSGFYPGFTFEEIIAPEPVIVPETRMSVRAFKKRLTTAERVAIRAAATTDPIVFDFIDLVDSSTFIDLTDQDTVDGLNYCEAQGLIAAGRANDILSAPVTDNEKI